MSTFCFRLMSQADDFQSEAERCGCIVNRITWALVKVSGTPAELTYARNIAARFGGVEE